LVNSDGQALFDIGQDPAQRRNLAAQHPDIVAQLRSQYDLFWQKISPRLTPVRIDLGNPGEPKTRLCSQDWHMPKGNPPWNFTSIRKLPKVTAPWLVDVKRAGRYRFSLRQWPAEANKPVIAKRAKITIAGQTWKGLVTSGCKAIVAEIDLPAGPTELLTYLYDQQDKAGGAYFTDIEWLGGSHSLPARSETSIDKTGPRE
jgi:hypothetical protein